MLPWQSDILRNLPARSWLTGWFQTSTIRNSGHHPSPTLRRDARQLLDTVPVLGVHGVSSDVPTTVKLILVFPQSLLDNLDTSPQLRHLNPTALFFSSSRPSAHVRHNIRPPVRAHDSMVVTQCQKKRTWESVRHSSVQP